MIKSLFIKPTNNLEAKNMSRLFNSNWLVSLKYNYINIF
jgi:hypothetical protein